MADRTDSGFRPGSILGTRVVRSEDLSFLTRGAVYTEDLADERLADCLFLTFVRSPVAHARILSIDTSAAETAPHVVAVLTAADLGDVAEQQPFMPGYPAAMAQPLLSGERVRYVGEPVVAVLTDDRYAGEDAAELVSVDYDPLPAVVDPRAALAGEVLLFPEAGTNVVFSSQESAEEDEFANCPVVVTHELVNQRLAAASLEGRSAAAAVEDDGRVTVWMSTQGAQGSKQAIVRMLGIEADRPRIITPDVGGGFGAKSVADVEHAVVVLAAIRTGRPVRWTETRSENMVGMRHGRAQLHRVTIGGDSDGRVTAYRLEVLQDSGAYPKLGGLLPSLTALMAPGVYDIPRVHTRFTSVVTNTTPIGAFRGAGRPEAAAAVERAMDLFAAELGMDPVEVRRRNLLPPFTEPHTTPTGAVYDSGDYPAALEKVLAAADYDGLRAEQAARRERGDTCQLGIGVSVYVEVTGGGAEAGAPSETAAVEIHPDGRVTVLTGTSSHGQGHATVWAMLASEELGVRPENITVRWGDTDLIPQGGGTMGSRSLQLGGAAVRQAVLEVIDQAKDRAAQLLEADRSDLVVDRATAGLAVTGVPGSAVSFAALAEQEPLAVRTVFSSGGATYPFGAHVAVVEVDVESGKARLVRLVALDDAGVVVNPLIAEGQVHGGLAQGVAQALLEEVLFDDDGNPTTTTFADYPIISATELPMFELVDSQTPTGFNPLGAKGIGESGTVGATPAVQSAVIDAVAHLGVRHIDMPLTPMRVWRAIRSASSSDGS
jgi:carbon-monoxide dehydrogenase large subunit